MIFDKPPDKIYLQYHGDSEPEDGPVDADDVTWCWHQIFDADIEYVLASEPTAQPADKISEAEEACLNVYMSIHISELSRYISSIHRAWYVGQNIWEDQKIK